jgi:hypothetical protein
MASEEAAAAKAAAAKQARRLALAKQTNSAQTQLAMRKMISERLSHPLLEQMRTKDFAHNPLAEADDAKSREMGRRLAAMQRSHQAQTAGIVSFSEKSDKERDAEWRASTFYGGGTRMDTEAKGLSDLVALKIKVQQNDVDGDGLDAQEFVRTLGSTWSEHSPQELMRLFMQVDADSDGRVTWEELLTFILQKEKASDGDEANRFLSGIGRQDADRRPLTAGAAHSAPMSQLLRMPDKDKYLSIARDSTMRLWSEDTLAHTRTIHLPDKCWINAASYCETHRRLALASAHSKLMVYHTESMRPQREMRLPTVGTALATVEQPELSAAWASCLLLGNKEGFVNMYDWEELAANNFEPKSKVRLHDGWIEKIELIRDAGGLLSCSADGTLKLHALGVHGDLKLRHVLQSPTNKAIVCFAYSAPNAAIATCGIERQVSAAAAPIVSSPLPCPTPHRMPLL